ncbi:hypothetical protein P3X46_019064 [Hevea brasiliensis]|uniref:Uncharacterized protein n=2 Tax=Hevea brasiliensis TaxID=3981 RepID=A0ABQ9LWU7_HEVBR|nr:hypothetical protein P3X46_019064 [Hevea brasiliensis]
MKAKIYSLRTQKMETNGRIVEMQSTIDSLKDEQKIMESALKEKQQEIKMHRETNIDTENENPQMIALMESLKQKETEIEDLKHRFENPIKILSVSTDDPSNPQTNLNVTANLAHKTQISDSKAAGGQLHESTNYSNGANSIRGDRSDNTSTTLVKGENTARLENRIENEAAILDRREVSIEEQSRKLESSVEGLRNEGAVDTSHGKKKGSSPDNGAFGAGQENNISNASEFVSSIGKVSQNEDANSDMKSADDKEHKVARDDKQLGLESTQQEEGRDQGTFKGEVKLELLDNIRSSTSRVKGKHAKGKRWRILARNRWLENRRNYEDNGGQRLKTRKFSHHDQNGLLDREEATASNEGRTDTETVKSRNNPLEVTRADDFSKAKLLEPQNPEVSEDQKVKPAIDDTNYHLKRVHEMRKRPHISQDGQLLTNESFHGNANDISSKDKKESLDEVRQNEGQEISGIEENRNNRNMNVENSADAEQVNAASNQERPGEIAAQEIDRQPDAVTGDSFRESFSDLEEDKVEYKGETDESEF